MKITTKYVVFLLKIKVRFPFLNFLETKILKLPILLIKIIKNGEEVFFFCHFKQLN